MSNTQTNQSPPQILLKDIHITNDNVAISVMAGMLEIAQRRGAFNMEEASKIWECIQKLQQQQVQQQPEPQQEVQPEVQPEVQQDPPSLSQTQEEESTNNETQDSPRVELKVSETN
tara:strand:- start:59 stop:406 length:348 start_codon:yes stop_codon:yes gene_type:complete